VILEVIHRRGADQNIQFGELYGPLQNHPGYLRPTWRAVQLALAEAWSWLKYEGFLIRDPAQASGTYILTRRGQNLETRRDLQSYREGGMLPPELLHPVLAEKVRPMFLRGDYSVAVFQAFKEVEVAVREAAGFEDAVVGVALMRQAFHSETGPLTDTGVISAERDALAHLFSGAIGIAKNPTSHRDVEIERRPAAQLIVFASYLLDLVTERDIAAQVLKRVGESD
jgi:uncharacterized protein (TIGR02391 family)